MVIEPVSFSRSDLHCFSVKSTVEELLILFGLFFCLVIRLRALVLHTANLFDEHA